MVESENGSFAQQTLHPKVKGYEYKKMDEEEKKERMGCGKVGLLDCDARKVKVSERLTRKSPLVGLAFWVRFAILSDCLKLIFRVISIFLTY